MIVAGIVLLLLGYLLPLLIPVPLVLVTVAIWLGWILLIVGVVLWLLGHVAGRPVAGRRHYWWTAGRVKPGRGPPAVAFGRFGWRGIAKLVEVGLHWPIRREQELMDMSGTDKAKNKAQDVKGKAKEAVGNITGDKGSRDEGRSDQAKSNVKDAGEKIKDAFKK
jgi:uncharacterized protein YjbJ (UPF0337 family)